MEKDSLILRVNKYKFTKIMQIFKYLKYRISNIIKHNRTLIGVGNLISSRKDYQNIKYLSEVEMKIYSQSGEDGIIDFLLDRINKKRNIKFVEIGVGDYEEANTRFIVETKPSTGLLIDYCEELKYIKKRNFYWQNQLYIENTKISPENINSILIKHDFLNDFDLLSLDIDGLDYWVLKEINLSKASIVICEFNPLFGSSKSVSIPNINNFSRDDYSKCYFGASLKAFISLMKEKNFLFLGTNSFCNNAFFVNQRFSDTFKNIIISDNKNHTDFVFREIMFSSKKNYKKKLLNKIKNLKLIELKKNESKTVAELFDLNEE